VKKLFPNQNILVRYVLNFTILLYLLRTTLPFLKFPLLFFLAILILFIVITKRNNLTGAFKDFIFYYFLVLILEFILVFSFLRSNKFYLNTFKDTSNTVLLLIVYFLLTLLITNKEDLKLFKDNLIRFLVYASLLISIWLIFNFFDVFHLSLKNSFVNKLSINFTTDYNFSLLPVFLGFMSVIYLLRESISKRETQLYNFFLIIYSLSIILSGSRRGIILLSIILIIIALVKFKKTFSKSKNEKSIELKYNIFIFSIIVLFLIIWGSIFHTSTIFKNKTLALLGLNENDFVKEKIAVLANRYTSIFDKNNSYIDSYNEIWNENLAKSLNPDKGWGTRIHKTIFPLNGKNVEIVHPRARGYLMDSTCDVSCINGNAISYSLIGREKVNKGDIIRASVFCFESKDFNGNSASISISGPVIGDSEYEYHIYDSLTYNITQNGNLINNGNFTNGSINWKPNADSTTHEVIETPFGKGLRVSRLGGRLGDWSMQYVGKPIIYYANHIYEFHFYYKVQKGSSLPFSIGWWVDDAGQGYYPSLYLPIKVRDINDGWKEAVCSYKFKKTHTGLYTFLNSMELYSIVDFANVELFDLNSNSENPVFSYSELEDKGSWQKLYLEKDCSDGEVSVYINFIKNGEKDFSHLKGYVIFAYPQYEIIHRQSKDSVQSIINSYQPNELSLFSINKSLITNLSTKNDIRKYISTLFVEDTTYYGYKHQLVIDTIQNQFTSGRLMRWQFACQIFLYEYDWKQKIFGGGFNFLNWFGYYFQKDKTVSDYPHNPFLSVLLYSGIIGLIVYLFFIYKVFFYYIKYLKEYYIFFVFFLITFFFSFFSAGSPFDPPIMGFFVILPFFINYIHEKSEKV
jgi:hypothetical protein